MTAKVQGVLKVLCVEFGVELFHTSTDCEQACVSSACPLSL